MLANVFSVRISRSLASLFTPLFTVSVLQHNLLLPGPLARLLPLAASARGLLLPAAAEPAGAPAGR